MTRYPWRLNTKRARPRVLPSGSARRMGSFPGGLRRGADGFAATGVAWEDRKSGCFPATLRERSLTCGVDSTGLGGVELRTGNEITSLVGATERPASDAV